MEDKKMPKILIVEDVDSNYLYLNAVLSRIEVQVDWVKNGSLAVDYVNKHKVDLILMDLQMPEMNGYEATTIIRKQHPEIPIIAQTAFAMADDKSRAIDAGCNDYLVKPIRSKDLIEIVEKYLPDHEF